MEELLILEKVRVGQKLRFRGGLAIDDTPNRVSRWLSGESMKSTLEGITDVIKKAMNLDLVIDSGIITALENLKVTYRKSKTMTKGLIELQSSIKQYSYERMTRPRYT